MPAIRLRIGVALAFVGAALGQQLENNAGCGAIYRRLDLGALTGNDGHLGCADVGGVLYVSARDPQHGGNHVIYAIGSGGALAATLPQPAAQAASAWGMRDLCSDGVNIAGGSEAGISIVTTSGALATTWNSRPIAQPIGGPVLAALGVPRGLAWNGAAANGAGRFYAVNFASAIYEFDVLGNITRTFPNRGWNGAGLAFDAATGNLWIDALPARGDLAELDLAGGTCAPTGRSIPRARPGSFEGGLGEASTAAGVHAPWACTFALVDVCQDAGDTLAVQRVDLVPGHRGSDEIRLATSVDGGSLDGTNKQFGLLDTVTFAQQDPTGAATNTWGWTLINFPPDSLVDDLTSLAALGLGPTPAPEHRTVNELSIAHAAPPAMVLVAPVGTPLSVFVGAGTLLPPGFVARAQGVTFDAQVPWLLHSTNEVYLQAATAQTGIVIEAVGGSSGAPAASRGFWRIAHQGGRAAIRSVSLDWTGTTVPGQETMVFDVDQPLGDGRHSGGNAAGTGCHGTWRQGSDVAAGLDYAHAGNYRAPCAAGSENAGFTIDSGTGSAARVLTYRFVGSQFAAGKTLEFDCDTDGGLGVAGDAMRGLAVRVQLVDNTLLTGTLAIDPLTPHRAWLRL